MKSKGKGIIRNSRRVKERSRKINAKKTMEKGKVKEEKIGKDEDKRGNETL